MTDKSYTIELLYFEDCPSWKNARKILKDSLIKLGIPQEVILTQVETQEEADENRFSGSPTIRINGEDLFPMEQDHYALGCRVYQTPEGFKGWPTEEMIIEKLQSFINMKR